MPSKSARKRVPTLALAIKPRREAEAWLAPIRAALPELRVDLLENFKAAEVDYGAAWGTAAGLQYCPNLKAIVSLGAGVDHILADKSLAHLLVIRMIDPGLTEGMSEFALLQVLHHHRRMPEFNASQQNRQWKPLLAPLARYRRVGIMGMGVLGRDAATHLRQIGFRVAGWSRTKHQMPGVRAFVGTESLRHFLAQSEILICLLPLTEETRGILNADLFAQLPKGAAVINLARGGHLIDSDLVAALDSGHLSGASLDVFHEEPLPARSPLWGHPQVTVTPHVASLTRRDTGALFVAKSVRSLIAGETSARAGRSAPRLLTVSAKNKSGKETVMTVSVASDALLAKIAKPIAPKGVIAAVLAPFDDKYEIDAPLLVDHAKWLLENGCNGLSTTGSTGEGNSMSTKQRVGLLDTLLKAGLPAEKMVPGTGAAALGDVVELTRHAVQAGCGGILVLPPYYYKNPSEDGLFAAFASLIEKVADSRLRVYLYHIPQFTAVPIPYAVIDRLIEAFPGTIAGLKDSFGDWSYSENLLKHLPGFAVYPGSEIFLSRVKKAGGGGCISGTVNFTAPLAAQVYAAKSDAEAEALQKKLDALRQIIESRPLVPSLKAIKGEMVGKPSWGRVLPPFTQLSDAIRIDLFKALDGALPKGANGRGWELRV